MLNHVSPTLYNPTDHSLPGFSAMGFFRQEYWSGLPCPPPGDLLDPGIKPLASAAPALQADSLPLSHWGSPLRSSGQVLCRLSLDWDLSGVLMIRLRLQVWGSGTTKGAYYLHTHHC